MAGRTLDRILEQGLGTAPRDELLRALEEHMGKPVTLAIELPDGSDLVTAWGILLGKGAQEEEVFTIDGDEGYVFALSHGWEDQERHETVTLHQVPKGQIDRYAGQEKGRSGYRIHLEGGIDLGLVLWAQDPHDPLEAVN